MALVNGLRPITEDRPEVSRSRRNARVESPELRREAQLRPTANPVDTFVRAPAPQQDNQFLALARGLGALNPAVNRVLDAYAEDARPAAEAAATRKLGGMTFEEARDAMKKGEITELQNPWFRAGWMKQYGARVAEWRAQQNATAYENDFDKDNDSADRLVAEGMKEDLELYGDDKHFVASYVPASEAAARKLRSAQAQYKSERLNSDTRDNVYSDFLTTVKTAKEEGKSPEEIQVLVRGKYKGNRELLNVPNKDQDREVLRVASALADEGDFATAKALLESDRTGDDGTKLGALKDNREFAADAMRVLAKAEGQSEENNRKAGGDVRMDYFEQANAGKLDKKKLLEAHKARPGTMTESYVQSLISRNDAELERLQKAREKVRLEARAAASADRLLSNDLVLGESGGLPFLGDGVVFNEQGDKKTVTGEKRREQVTTAKMELEDAEVARQVAAIEKSKAPDAVARKARVVEQALNRKVDWLSKNGAVNPQWKSVLESGAAAGSLVSTSGGETPRALASGFELYKQLQAKNPRLLTQHLKDSNAIEFYEAARLAEQYMGQDTVQALQTAVTVTRDSYEPENRQAYRQRYDDLQTAVRSSTSWLGGRSMPRNSSRAMVEIERLAGVYLRLGMSSNDALKEASKVYQARSTQVNGWDVYTGDRAVPPDFAPIVEETIRSYVRDNPNEGLDADEISIAPDPGTGAWRLIDTTNGRPLRNRGQSVVTIESMAKQHAQDVAKEAAQNATERNAAADARKAAGNRRLGVKPRFFVDEFDATATDTR